MNASGQRMTDEEFAEYFRTHVHVVLPFMGGRCFYITEEGEHLPAMHLKDDDTAEDVPAEKRLASNTLQVFGAHERVAEGLRYMYTFRQLALIVRDVPYDRTYSKPGTWCWPDDRARVFRRGSGMVTLVIP